MNYDENCPKYHSKFDLIFYTIKKINCLQNTILQTMAKKQQKQTSEQDKV